MFAITVVIVFVVIVFAMVTPSRHSLAITLSGSIIFYIYRWVISCIMKKKNLFYVFTKTTSDILFFFRIFFSIKLIAFFTYSKYCTHRKAGIL